MKLQALFEASRQERASGPKEMLVEMNDVISERMERNYFITAVVGMFWTYRSNEARPRAGRTQPPAPLLGRRRRATQMAQAEAAWASGCTSGRGLRRGFGGERRLSLDTGDVLLVLHGRRHRRR